MSIRKINGRWYEYRANIREFFRVITNGKPIEVPDDGLAGFDEDSKFEMGSEVGANP